jgi:hypothetical protein
VARIVGIKAAADQLFAVQRVVVGVRAGLGAVGHRALRIPSEYAGAKPGFVLVAIATLGGATALPVGLGAAASAAPLLCEFRA